jgi:uncharacterized membrane protein
MLPVEAHLFLNHVPLVGLVFGLVFFVAGLKRSSDAARRAGLRIFVAMGILVLPVAGSGLVSANVLADAAWLDSDAVSRHQLAGILTLVVLVGLGGLSGVMLFGSRNTPASSARANLVVTLLAIAGLCACAWTAYLGGALRHSELGRGRAALQGAGESRPGKVVGATLRLRSLKLRRASQRPPAPRAGGPTV